MTRPIRLQLSRTRGFDLQAVSRAANGLPARKVTRPGPFGNWLCPGRPNRLWIRAGSLRDGDIRTTLTAVLPGEAIEMEEAAAIYRTWLARPTLMVVPGIGSLDREFRAMVETELARKRGEVLALLPRLRGLNLACTCPLTRPDGSPCPCHADVLIELANWETKAV